MPRHRHLLIAAVAGTAALAGAGPATARPAAKPTIVQVAAANPQFSTLVGLVKAAGLAHTLSTGSYTVFAPTNAAFKKVPKATLQSLAAHKAQLRKVLLYHVLKGRVPAAKAVKLSSAKTVEGSRVKIKVKSGRVYLNSTRRVTKTDVKASNGIIHVINGVLLPPSS